MKAERLYASLQFIASSYIENAIDNNDLKERMKKEMLAHPANYIDCGIPALNELAFLLSETLQDMESKITSRESIAAIKHVIDNGYKGKKELGGIWQDDGMYCVSDGYRLIRLKKDIASLPHTSFKMDTKKLIAPLGEGRIEMKLPTIAELKAFIATHPKQKDREPSPFIVDGFYPLNPWYLKDIMTALPDCKAYLPQKINRPVFLEAENGDAVILPIRLNSMEWQESCIARLKELWEKSA